MCDSLDFRLIMRYYSYERKRLCNSFDESPFLNHLSSDESSEAKSLSLVRTKFSFRTISSPDICVFSRFQTTISMKAN